MTVRARLVTGSILGFLVPIVWLVFRGVFFTDTTIVAGAFEQRAPWLDRAAPAVLGWLVGAVFAQGFTLAALASVFTEPERTLQPAVAKLIQSKLWLLLVLVFLTAEARVVLLDTPRALPDLPSGLAWELPQSGPLGDATAAQSRALRKITAHPRDETATPANRAARIPLARVTQPALFSFRPLKARFVRLAITNEVPSRCAVEAGEIPLDALLEKRCLIPYADQLSSAISRGVFETVRGNGLDFVVAPSDPVRLTIKKEGELEETKLTELLRSWRTLGQFEPFVERYQFDQAKEAIGHDKLTVRLVDRAAEDLLPSGPAWAIPSIQRAARLSSALRLIHACSDCSANLKGALLDRLREPIKRKLVGSKSGRLVVLDTRLATDWARISAWWSEFQNDASSLMLALGTLESSGAESHKALLENLGARAPSYVDAATMGELRKRFIQYARSHRDFCSALLSRVTRPGDPLQPLLTDFAAEALTKPAACDLSGAVLAGGAVQPSSVTPTASESQPAEGDAKARSSLSISTANN